MFPWNRLAAFLPTGLLQGATSSELSSPDIDQPLGEAAVGQIFTWRGRFSREVSAYSTVFPEFAQWSGWKCFLG
jgi:hypothetical protein